MTGCLTGEDMMRIGCGLICCAVISAMALPQSGTAQLQMQRDITCKLGLEIEEAAIEACAKNNVPISVGVADRAGRIRIFISADNPSPHSLDLARRKAYTARTFRRPSLEWAANTEPGKDAA